MSAACCTLQPVLPARQEYPAPLQRPG